MPRKVMSTKEVCAGLLYIKKCNPTMPVFKLFKTYLACKSKALQLYNAELSKSNPINEEISIDITSPDEPTTRKRKIEPVKCKSTKRRKISKKDDNAVDVDCEETEEKDTPVWAQFVPYTWAEVFAPAKASDVLGNESEFTLLYCDR